MITKLDIARTKARCIMRVEPEQIFAAVFAQAYARDHDADRAAESAAIAVLRLKRLDK